MRRSIFPLSGIRITILAFVAVSLAFVISISSPRPAHAEGFLSGTVKCIVSILLPGECKRVTIQPEPVPNKTPAPSNPATPTPEATPQPNTSSQTSSTNETVQGRSVYYEPITVEKAAIPVPAPLPQINTVNHTAATGSGGAQYLAYMNIHGAYDPYGVKGMQTSRQFALAETSHEGWKLAGVAWYWWALGIAVIGGIISYGKYKLVKKNQLLSKAQ